MKPFIRAKLISIAVIVGLLGLWGAKEWGYPYNHSWFYRTFLQSGFNADVTIKVELDHKPYVIRRIIRCQRESVHSELAFTNYAYLPAYTAFGIRTDDGRGIVVATPTFCQQRLWKNTDPDDWSIDVPEKYIPFLSLLDNADNPTALTAYISHLGYSSPNAHLQFKAISIKPAYGFLSLALAADEKDQFAAFGQGYIEDPSRYWRGEKWIGHSLVDVRKNIWNNDGYHFFRNSADKDMLSGPGKLKSVSAAEPQYIDGKFIQGSDIFSSLPLNQGTPPGPLLDGSTMPGLTNSMFPGEAVPYRLKNGVWELDVSSRGLSILYPTDGAQNEAPVTDKGDFQILSGSSLKVAHCSGQSFCPQYDPENDSLFLFPLSYWEVYAQKK